MRERTVVTGQQANAERVAPVAVTFERAVTYKGFFSKEQVPTPEAETYVRTTDARLEASTFTTDAGVLLAPELSSIVSAASSLYAQVDDAAAKLMTEPRATPAPTPRPSPTIAPSPSPTARP